MEQKFLWNPGISCTNVTNTTWSHGRYPLGSAQNSLLLWRLQTGAQLQPPHLIQLDRDHKAHVEALQVQAQYDLSLSKDSTRGFG